MKLQINKWYMPKKNLYTPYPNIFYPCFKVISILGNSFTMQTIYNDINDGYCVSTAQKETILFNTEICKVLYG